MEMNNNKININNLVPINTTEIVRNYRSKIDRKNFYFEHNWSHPDEPGFDSTFFLKILTDEKRYLPNNFTINYDLKYFCRGKKLDKQYIISKMIGNPAYAEFTPDDADPKKFSKKFLLIFIAFVEPNLFKNLYSIQKHHLAAKSYSNWQEYKINVKN